MALLVSVLHSEVVSMFINFLARKTCGANSDLLRVNIARSLVLNIKVNYIVSERN